MTTTVSTDQDILSRILREGYGDGAWHGPDLKSAVSDVTAEQAFRRPAPGRHNVAEIVAHHAWFVRSVAAQLTGRPPADFPIAGEDWFELDAGSIGWDELRDLLAALQLELSRAAADIAAERVVSPMAESDRFDVVLGITGHAIYHAGQIQLIKRLISA